MVAGNPTWLLCHQIIIVNNTRKPSGNLSVRQSKNQNHVLMIGHGLHENIKNNVLAGVYHYVPMQDFSHPWTDEMLYEMYDITDDERKYIESMIKPMKDEEAGQLTINFS